MFFHKDFIEDFRGIDGTVHTPEWSFRGAVILPGGAKRVCSSVKSGVLLRNSHSDSASILGPFLSGRRVERCPTS